MATEWLVQSKKGVSVMNKANIVLTSKQNYFVRLNLNFEGKNFNRLHPFSNATVVKYRTGYFRVDYV